MAKHQANLQRSSDLPSGSTLQAVIEALDEIILGKPKQVRLSLACVLAKGHLLVEDVPGVGKTTLVKSLAQVLGLETKRVQFTNDLLPADILGTAIFDSNLHQFRFHQGPIFTQVLIADELNRGTPRTQSAFLQAMEERKVSIEGEIRDLPNPFFVVATQNPREQVGTYALPESQLDRFLMRIHLGYLEDHFEMQLLRGKKRRDEDVKALLTVDEVLFHQEKSQEVHTSDLILAYVQRILKHSRVLRQDFSGLSPRAGLAMLRSARAWAYLHGRDFVLPEDVQSVAPWVINHRLSASSATAHAQAEQFLASVAIE